MRTDPQPAATVRRAGPAPQQSSAIVNPLSAGVGEDVPRRCEHGRAASWLICLGAARAGERRSPPFPPMPGAGGREGPVIVRVGKLFPITASCKTQESRPCVPLGQHNRFNPISRGVGEPDLKSRAWDSCSHSPSGWPTLQLPRIMTWPAPISTPS